MHTPDEQVIARVQQGEAAAFGEVFHRHYPGVRRYLLHTFASGDDADDLAVEVFVRVFQGVPGFCAQSDGSLAAYIYTIARNLVRDTGRCKSAWWRLCVQAPQPEEAPAETEADLDVPWEGLLQDEAASRIRAALELLPDEDRHILVLSYQQDLSARDVMTVLAKPSEAAVRAHVYRALKRLRGIVSRDRFFAEEQPASTGGERNVG